MLVESLKGQESEKIAVLRKDLLFSSVCLGEAGNADLNTAGVVRLQDSAVLLHITDDDNLSKKQRSGLILHNR